MLSPLFSCQDRTVILHPPRLPFTLHCFSESCSLRILRYLLECWSPRFYPPCNPALCAGCNPSTLRRRLEDRKFTVIMGYIECSWTTWNPVSRGRRWAIPWYYKTWYKFIIFIQLILIEWNHSTQDVSFFRICLDHSVSTVHSGASLSHYMLAPTFRPISATVKYNLVPLASTGWYNLSVSLTFMC